MIKKGDIYLADFGKSRDSFAFGKKRPVLIFQTDKLNYAIEENIYRHIIAIPLSTKDDILTQEFRYKIPKRDHLEQDSYIVCNSICFLETKYLCEKLTSLTPSEIVEIEKILIDLFDISHQNSKDIKK
jgi:mRNA-degrading endonuclease toxin of MazEF toxin-antitoxin module